MQYKSGGAPQIGDFVFGFTLNNPQPCVGQIIQISPADCVVAFARAHLLRELTDQARGSVLELSRPRGGVDDGSGETEPFAVYAAFDRALPQNLDLVYRNVGGLGPVLAAAFAAIENEKQMGNAGGKAAEDAGNTGGGSPEKVDLPAANAEAEARHADDDLDESDLIALDAAVKAAAQKLVPADPSHWTKDGKPDLTVLAEFVGVRLKRAQVDKILGENYRRPE